MYFVFDYKNQYYNTKVYFIKIFNLFFHLGESMSSLHYQFRLGRTIIGVIMKDTLNALKEGPVDEYLKFPSTVEEWEEISNVYLNRLQIR